MVQPIRLPKILLIPGKPSTPFPDTMSDALSTLLNGTAQVHSKKELADKLASGRPLRAKLGLDPTAPDIHLGHTIVFEKLRQFQELGHTAVLIIGDFTATVGDPSGRSATRPPLSRHEVLCGRTAVVCARVPERDA